MYYLPNIYIKRSGIPDLTQCLISGVSARMFARVCVRVICTYQLLIPT